MAAAGLWTTPTDLARYAIGVQQMFAGKSSVLSADMTRQMLTEQNPDTDWDLPWRVVARRCVSITTGATKDSMRRWWRMPRVVMVRW